MIQPRLRRREAIFRADRFRRKIVEGPHALFGLQRLSENQAQGDKREQDRATGRRFFLHCIPSEAECAVDPQPRFSCMPTANSVNATTETPRHGEKPGSILPLITVFLRDSVTPW